MDSGALIAALEICVDDEAGLLAALNGGAERIELCADLDQGGLTPGRELLRHARDSVCAVPLFAMLRPRPGSFVYTVRESQTIRRELDLLLEEGVDGVVFGALDGAGGVDSNLAGALRVAAPDVPFTFHRAFDGLAEKAAARKRITQLGYQRILTSGGPGPALEHLEELTGLCAGPSEEATLLVGGGVRSENVARIVAATHAREVHSSARLAGRTDENEVRRLRLALEP